jgi:branched-chain amino acid transport system ATP-binding protein
MSVLKVEGLTKSFGGLKVLTGVTFDIESGERLALIGPNGAGKSTLLNAIGGQDPASGGKIFFDDKEITYLSPNKRLRLGIGRSYQTNNLFWQMTILDNVLISFLGPEKRHFRMIARLQRMERLVGEAKRLLTAVGLWEKRHETPFMLSYGDQRLLELLMAFAANPKCVLLDEPSAGFPTAEAVAFADIIRNLAAKDTAIVFCAHDMDLVFNLADKIMVLYFGQILIKGTPEEIRENPKVKEIYLGSEEQQNA